MKRVVSGALAVAMLGVMPAAAREASTGHAATTGVAPPYWVDNYGPVDGAFGVDVDRAGRRFVSSIITDELHRFSPSGTLVETVGGTGAAPGQFSEPAAVVLGPDGYVYVADQLNDRVQVFTKGLDFVRAFGTEGSGPGEFDDPMGLAFQADGNLLVVEWLNHRVQVVDPETGAHIAQFGDQGNGDGQFGTPPSDAVVLSDGRIVVTEFYGGRFHVFDADYDHLYSSTSILGYPFGVDRDAKDRIYITNSGPRLAGFLVLSPDHYGVLTRLAVPWDGRSGIDQPRGLAIAPNQRIHVTDVGRDRASTWAFRRCRGALATHVGSNGDNTIHGTSARDVIVARGGDDTVNGRGGNDLICLGGGSDLGRGGRGADTVLGQHGNDRILGKAGHDDLEGGNGKDLVDGNGGGDDLAGNSGQDVLRGRTGPDHLNGGGEIDICHGGGGPDTAVSCENRTGIP